MFSSLIFPKPRGGRGSNFYLYFTHVKTKPKILSEFPRASLPGSRRIEKDIRRSCSQSNYLSILLICCLNKRAFADHLLILSTEKESIFQQCRLLSSSSKEHLSKDLHNLTSELVEHLVTKYTTIYRQVEQVMRHRGSWDRQTQFY